MFLIGFLSNAISIIVNSSYLALNNTKFILIKKIIIEIKVGKIICISDFSHNNTMVMSMCFYFAYQTRWFSESLAGSHALKRFSTTQA